jgi:hypothetical protein
MGQVIDSMVTATMTANTLSGKPIRQKSPN